jgi:hypothetical protein
MAGATIDHMISLTILIAALLVAMMTYNGMFASAVDYDRNRQVANKAIDIMNTFCLSPGNPTDWGETNDTLLGFGLQDPEAGGYVLSPYSLMRLNTAHNESQLVYYDGTGMYYNNISTNYGHAILTPLGDCINYTTATELLGINGTYGFSLDITSTLDVNVSQVSTNPLVLNVDVTGSGLPLSGATLNYHLFNVENTGNNPWVLSQSGVEQTNSSGSADIVFSEITDHEPVYSFTVYVSLGGVNGVGYYTSNSIADDTFVVPLVEDYDLGKLILAHSFSFLPGHEHEHAEFKFNATFFILTSDFQLQEVDLNCSGHLTYGEGFDFVRTQIPPSEVGILVISYMVNPNLIGTVIVPWGVGALGVSVSFDGDIGSGGYDFVATEVRQVTIDNISYQVKVSAWSLNG